MADNRLLDRVVHGLIYVGLCGCALFVRLLPLPPMLPNLPAPEIMLCLTLAWMLRRPDYLPAWLITVMFLLSDFFLYRPPGLNALIVTAICTLLRSRNPAPRPVPFTVEIALITGLVLSVVTANWLAQALLFIQHPSYWRTIAVVPVTVLAYPFTLALSHYVIGIRRLKPRYGRIRGLRA
ncbi:hypothetical protein [Qingshengfaniella alkalisoli]|uniref:Rod shape-determining protein MreD n=1 Tax=Qingshengfaniella alkalisoli TaxID=2599296 RepID=A0A5B8ITR7_9RHOB|nr:hypothetical protein [Qingshengfaniella alkalisoli]QDY69612.1 hypothetical protein FPZ52_08235 [Qingshengfaniella alkalisoli]